MEAKSLIERVLQGEDPKQVVEAKIVTGPKTVHVGPWSYFEDIDYTVEGSYVDPEDVGDYDKGELEVDDSSFIQLAVGIPPAGLQWDKSNTVSVMQAIRKSGYKPTSQKPTAPHKKMGNLRLFILSSNDIGEQVTKNQRKFGVAMRTSVVNSLKRAGFNVVDSPKLKV